MLVQKIKKAPKKAGVYLFKNKDNKVIYVGRSVNLKERLKSYLKPFDLKTQVLINEAKNITIKKTDALYEAVILEANLIKKYQPKYNIREKDNRSFAFIVIPKISWSYPLIIRAQKLQKYQPKEAEIFGPFKSFTIARNLLLLLRKVFPYSTCQFNSGKPCFHFQIGLCPGKCLGIISEKEYQKNIDNLIEILGGKKKKVIKTLREAQPEKIPLLLNLNDSILISKEEKLPFELARKRIEAYDISHLAGKETVGAMVVFQNEDFDKSQYRLFKIKTNKPGDDISALKEVLERRLKHREWPLPDLVLIDGGRGQVNLACKILNSLKINIPVVGIAKFKTEKLIFSKMEKSLKELISLSFDELKRIRDEAHRFANSYRKKLLKKSINL